MNRFRSVLSAVLALCAILLALSQESPAIPLPPGGVTFLSGTTAAERPELIGLNLAGHSVLGSFEIDLGPGMFVQTLVRELVNQEHVAGTLDFYDQLFNNASLGPVTSFSRCCFGGFSTDVDFRPDGSGTVAPTGAARSLDGNIIEFDFSQRPLMPGETAFYLMIKTDATLSDLRGTFDARSGKIGSSFKIPTNGSPEPVFPPPVPTPYGASLFLCAIGVGGMLISKRCVDRIRRRRSSASRTQRA